MQVGALDVKLREVLAMNYSELNVQFMKALSEYEDVEARSGCLTKQQFKEMLIRIIFYFIFVFFKEMLSSIKLTRPLPAFLLLEYVPLLECVLLLGIKLTGARGESIRLEEQQIDALFGANSQKSAHSRSLLPLEQVSFDTCLVYTGGRHRS
jgi:hypothetical protein